MGKVKTQFCIQSEKQKKDKKFTIPPSFPFLFTLSDYLCGKPSDYSHPYNHTMRRKLVFATNNAHKLEEISAILGEKVELLSLKDIHCEADIPETADTLEGNAIQKAEYIYQHYGLDCFADDTGLEVEALHGEPGVFSARYAGGAGHNSEANMQKLLQNLQGIDNRQAQFRTAICLILDGKTHLYEGIVKGEIIRERRGATGFGYDPIFVPEGYHQTFAELGNEVKNRISHRARAVEKLCRFLKA